MRSRALVLMILLSYAPASHLFAGEMVNPHWTGIHCTECHVSEEGGELRFTGDQIELCTRCHGVGDVSTDRHPVGIELAEFMRRTIPAGWPLQSEKITCLTCHDARPQMILRTSPLSGRTLLALINDILDLSKIEAGKLELQYEPVCVPKLVEEIQKLFSINAGEKGIKLLVEIDPKLPRGLMLDEVRLRQVLFNVVGNALKFTEQGHVKIKAQAEPVLATTGEEPDETRINLILEISDTGIGMPKAQQDHIFGAFSQVAGQSTRKFGGTGLGLTITKRLTEMMHGVIVVESEPGQGSTFRLEFPNVAITELAEADAVATGGEGDFTQFAPATILVADDVALNRALLTGYFEGTGHQVVLATNGREALEQAEKHRPDVILRS